MGQWFAKCGPQTKSISLIWELAKSVSGKCTFSGPVPYPLNPNLCRWGPAICILTCSPGDSDECPGLRPTCLGHGLKSLSCLEEGHVLPNVLGASLQPWDLVWPHSIPLPPTRMKAFWAWSRESPWRQDRRRAPVGGSGRREAGRLPQLIFSSHESPREAQASSPLKLANYRMMMVILPIMMIIALIM